MNKKSIFITGGAGYVGSRLVPMLLDKGYVVTVYDILYFGDEFLPKNNPNLKVIKGDLRDYDKLKKVVRIHEIFVHLACVSNDASFVLDENFQHQ